MSESGNSKVTVDDLHDRIDSLVLTIFESMREATQNDSNNIPSASLIQEKLKETIESIDNLVGIDNTEEKQMEKIKELSAEYEQTKQSVIKLEKQLIHVKNVVDNALENSVCPDRTT